METTNHAAPLTANEKDDAICVEEKPATMQHVQELVPQAPSSRRKYSDETRKVRHRDRMRRTRLRDQQSIETKRQQVDVLYDELTRILTPHREQKWKEEEVVILDDDALKHAQHLQLFQNPQALQRQYVGLVLQQERIQQENQHLRTYLEEKVKHARKISAQLDRTLNQTQNSTASWTEMNNLEHRTFMSPINEAMRFGLTMENGDRGYWIQFTDDEPFVFYNALSTSACKLLVGTAYQQWLGVQQRLALSTDSLRIKEILGWNVTYTCMHRNRGNNTPPAVEIHHRHVKQIHVRPPGTVKNVLTIDEIAQAMWQILNDPELFARIYYGKTIARIIQKLDDNTSILMRTYPNQNLEMTSRFVSVLAKMEDQIEDSVRVGQHPHVHALPRRRRMMVLSSLFDPELCFQSTSCRNYLSQSRWLTSGGSCFYFTELPDGIIELEYVGSHDIGDEAHLDAVARNVTEAVVQLEQAMTSPVTVNRLLPPSS